MEGRGKADLRDSSGSSERVKVEKFKKGNMAGRTCADVQVRQRFKAGAINCGPCGLLL